MAERTPERLTRLLGMVAYLDRHQGVTVEQMAGHFGVPPAQILRDVDTLWMSGTPGYWPHDLIDFDSASLEHGVLRLTESRGMSRALRLGAREAVSLVAALRALRESVGEALDAEQRAVLTSTLDALVSVTGEAAGTVDVQLSVGGVPEAVAQVRTALVGRRRLRLRYVDAADTVSEREVDPWQLVTGDERSYLQAWCHEARGERLFRLDRILEARALQEPVTRAAGSRRDTTVFQPEAEHERVVLELDGRARWVAEQLPVDELTELADGGFRIVLPVASPAWLQHLLLRVAGYVRAVEPAALAGQVAAVARRALAAYDEDPSGGSTSAPDGPG
ncbi:YafY family protein [Actinotalea sp. K2]|uniref:helix-turn-helix transcriptional regulator n=1 Tax=Actinotalea sp. K2 TaxID=2939438 RepID=UPI0020178C1B|nr:WYL domain-containing protein [Actinotalea sp. K2]MCL3862803.1 WYL domain-containing protein [Actinotalea sp. K2]